jgi:hypothetical protein
VPLVALTPAPSDVASARTRGAGSGPPFAPCPAGSRRSSRSATSRSSPRSRWRRPSG